MKTLINANPASLEEAVSVARQVQLDGNIAAFSGGGTDLLQQIKDRTAKPDVIINLRTVNGANEVSSTARGLSVGGLITLTELSEHALIRNQFTVLAEAADTVGSPQIRNVGTLAGNVTQRPWCWYYRNGFPCYKAGGEQCFSVDGQNQLQAIFGGGPSYIVHPSDLAPALVALNASFEIIGPNGRRSMPSAEFFVLPRVNAERENILETGELLAGIHLPTSGSNTHSTYHKVMDREAWTHAVVSVAVVLEIDGEICRSASIVLGGVAPVPWRVPEAEKLLVGHTVTEELAHSAGEVAVQGARPLAKNAYKIPLAIAAVERAILAVSS